MSSRTQALDFSRSKIMLRTRYNDYGKNFRDRIGLGAFFTAADYISAIRFRRERRFERSFPRHLA